jgi:hypothetical protein
MLGEEHLSTLTSINNLAAVLRDQGKYDLAEEMYRQELRLCETILGQDHPIHTDEHEHTTWLWC